MLLAALQHTRHAIHPKSEIPVLKNFVLTFDGNIMTVQTSNTEVWIEETVVLDDIKGEPRPIAVYFSDLLRTIKALEQQPLHFEVGEMQMTVRHSYGSFRLPLENNAEEFLAFHKPSPDIYAPDALNIEYEAPVLRSILSKCAYAMADDELRPAMNGVYFNFTSTHTDYVASDGHILARVRKAPATTPAGTPSGQSCIMPKRIVNALLRILPRTGDVCFDYRPDVKNEKTRLNSHGQMETYTVVERKAMARFLINDTISLYFCPVDGRYPAYWSVIPDTYNFEMSIDRLLLIKSVDRLSIFANDSSGLMYFTVNGDHLDLKAEDKDLELSGEESLPCETKHKDGNPMTGSVRFGLKDVSLAKTLKVLNSEKVRVCILDSSRAFIFQPCPQPDTEELTMLLMPMLIND